MIIVKKYHLNYTQDFNTFAEFMMQQAEVHISFLATQYRGLNGMDADDIAQELRLRLWKVLPKYNPNNGSGNYRNWMITTLNRKVIDMSRRKKDMVDCRNTLLPEFNNTD